MEAPRKSTSACLARTASAANRRGAWLVQFQTDLNVEGREPGSYASLLAINGVGSARVNSLSHQWRSLAAKALIGGSAFPPLVGRSILVAEDEPLIALDLERVLEGAGATVLITGAVTEALRLAETASLSAAVIDHRLNGGDGAAVCHLLSERHLPFLFYTGYPADAAEQGSAAPVITKPAPPEVILDAVIRLLNGR